MHTDDILHEMSKAINRCPPAYYISDLMRDGYTIAEHPEGTKLVWFFSPGDSGTHLWRICEPYQEMLRQFVRQHPEAKVYYITLGKKGSYCRAGEFSPAKQFSN